MGRDEGWLAEHMLILGVTNPEGKKYHVAAAFPSRLRQDQLRHADPAQGLRGLEGHDRRRRHRLDQARRRRPPVRHQPRSRLLRRGARHQHRDQPQLHGQPGQRHDLHQRGADRRRRRVVGRHGRRRPAHAIDWQGKDWTPQIAKETGAKAAHPNARFTVAATNNPALDPAWDDPKGVPIDAFIFGGRRSTTVPLVTEARNWVEGVYMAATMGSRDHRRRHRPGGRGAPRPVRHAALLRLQHGRLLPALAGPGQEARSRRAPRCRASSPPTGSARARTASSSGRATARTCACSSG